MAINSRLFPAPAVASPGCVIIAGRVAIGATGAVGTQTGKGFSVTRTDTGDYTVQVQSQGASATVPAILYAHAALAVNSDTQFIAQVRVAPTTGAVTVTCFANAALDTPADPPSGASLMVYIVAQNTSSAR
jgi:hypothetical protein